MAKRKAREMLRRMGVDRKDAGDVGNGGGRAICVMKPLVLCDDGVRKERMCWTSGSNTMERQIKESRNHECCCSCLHLLRCLRAV